MRTIKTTLPWSGEAILQVTSVRELLAHRLGPDERFLPRIIDLFAENSVRLCEVERFLHDASSYLAEEIPARKARVRRISRSTDLAIDELEHLLTGRQHCQKWALFCTQSGGLPIPEACESRGVVPCSSMRNHGVAWDKQGNLTEIWLLTARKPNQPWDMDSDIGHESAHAAFAPVPLFVDADLTRNGDVSLVDVDGPDDLAPQQIARLLYFYCEIAVVAVRGEGRSTNTRLPIDDPEELYQLVWISDRLFPGLGFARALYVCGRVNNYFDPQESDAIFDLAAPILRLLPKLNTFVAAKSPPTLRVVRDRIKASPFGSVLI